MRFITKREHKNFGLVTCFTGRMVLIVDGKVGYWIYVLYYSTHILASRVFLHNLSYSTLLFHNLMGRKKLCATQI